MNCIYCGSATDVINSRPSKRTNSIWRRRKCKQCGSIFTTSEVADLASALRIETQDSGLVPFQKDVLLTSIYDCCKHLKNPAFTASELTNTIVNKILKNNTAVISRQNLITLTYDTLQLLDEAAAIQYRAFHQ